MIAECMVCAYEIDGKERVPSLTACAHNSMCSLCTLRIRALHRNVNCVTCKRQLDHVICTDKVVAKFEDFAMWGDSIGPEFVLDQKSQMFFPTKYYKEVIQKLWVHKCKICSHTFRDMKALRAHVSAEHNMHICLHCVENKHDFPAEQRVYTQKQYETHLREGDQDGSQGHPNCEFCRKRYYDSTALFVHLNKDHYNCHLCEKNGIKFKYYKDYNHMEEHFRKHHLLCDDPVCLAKKFIVFDNEIDLEVHNRKYHPSFVAKRASTIKLDFKLARNNNNSSTNLTHGHGHDHGDEQGTGEEDFNHSNGGASGRYEGGLGGRARDGEWQVELQPISSDPRDINRNAHITPGSMSAGSSGAMMGGDAHTNAIQEDFPTLQGSSNNTGPITLTNKWVSMGTSQSQGGARRPKKGDFPALQSNKAAAPTTMSAKLGGGGGGASSVSAMQREYDSLGNATSGAVGSSPRAVSGSLGDWARIKVDTRKVGGVKAGAAASHTHTGASSARASAGANYTSTAYANTQPLGADYEKSLAIALAESLSDAYRAPPPPHSSITTASASAAGVSKSVPSAEYTTVPVKGPPLPPPPPPPQSAEAYPSLAGTATVPATATTKQAPKKKAPSASAGAGGWGEALQAMGMASAAKKTVVQKKKLTVIKASSSTDSGLNKLDSSSSFSPVNASSGSNASTASYTSALTAPTPNWDNLKPMTKNTEVEYRIGSAGKVVPVRGAVSTAVSSSTTSSSSSANTGKYGGWAKMGGATNGSIPSQVSGSGSSVDYPSLGGGKRTK